MFFKRKKYKYLVYFMVIPNSVYLVMPTCSSIIVSDFKIKTTDDLVKFSSLIKNDINQNNQNYQGLDNSDISDIKICSFNLLKD